MRPSDAWKRWVPKRRRKEVIERRLRIREAIDGDRGLPDFMIIGAQRSGTSSMYKWLELHPDVVSSIRKETEYLSYKFGNGIDWYRAHFPSRWRRAGYRAIGRDLITFEATPYYLFHPHAPARAAALVPDIPLVAILRNPVDRAWSHWRHMRRHEQEDLGFEDAIAREEERLAPELARLEADPTYVSKVHERWSYVGRGRYAEQLERWLVHYPTERLLVLRSEDLYADPTTAYHDVLRFLGLPVFTPRAFRNASHRPADQQAESVDMATETREHLQQAFAPENRRLARLLGRDMGWD